jgi:MFS family permease
MVGVGLWIRLGILETPVFRRIVAENQVERAPMIEVFRKHPKEIALTALLRLAEQSPGYIFNAFIFTYGTQVLGASRDLLLIGLIVTTALGFCWAPIAGALSDRIGRRQMYIIGCVFVAVFTFVYFAMLDTRVPVMIFIAVALSFIPVMTMYGPEAALIAEAFPPRLRYSGASIGYQLASIIAGGPAPFISTWLFSTYNSTVPIGIYVVICAVISIAATLMLPDYTNKEISTEADLRPPPPAAARDRPWWLARLRRRGGGVAGRVSQCFGDGAEAARLPGAAGRRRAVPSRRRAAWLRRILLAECGDCRRPEIGGLRRIGGRQPGAARHRQPVQRSFY